MIITCVREKMRWVVTLNGVHVAGFVREVQARRLAMRLADAVITVPGVEQRTSQGAVDKFYGPPRKHA